MDKVKISELRAEIKKSISYCKKDLRKCRDKTDVRAEMETLIAEL
jgi:DNA replication protein DnaD